MSLSLTTLVTYIFWAVIILGGLAALVSIITQVTKDIGFLAKIPTKLQVVILSIALSELGYFIYVAVGNSKIIWYYIVGAVLLGFIVALIASEGWTYVIAIVKRYVSPSVVSEVTEAVTDAVSAVTAEEVSSE